MRQVSRDAQAALIDEAVRQFTADDPTPGLVVGLVAEGQLVHVSAAGLTVLDGGRRPDQDTVFRIASMTKSFTAATTLVMRDRGLLRLDDNVSTWLPMLADPSPRGVPLTLRHLLTMAAGFATDDPWGDRQQAVPLEVFDALVTDGFSTVWTPGTRFEYSNLGYAVLGRVLAAASGTSFDALVSDVVLAPLGLASTTFHPPGADRLAQGYAMFDGTPTAEPVAGYGAFAPMGGLFSTVADLARWVQWFLDAEQDVQAAAPLSAASRREMSQTQRMIGAEVVQTDALGAMRVVASGYGFGLVEELASDVGRVVSHSGGYPGFGSHMRWHPASGLGLVALGSRTYSPMRRLIGPLLDDLVRREATSPSPLLAGTTRAAVDVERLLSGWDDDAAAALFADNVSADEPLARRQAKVGAIAEEIGQLQADDEPPQSDSSAHRLWWLRGERGRLGVEILLSPERVPRVEAMSLTVVPDPGRPLQGAASCLVAAINSPDPVCPIDWPDGVTLADEVDEQTVTALLRAVAARLGAVVLGKAQSHDNTADARTVVWQLVGERGRGRLQVGYLAPGTVTSVTARFTLVTTV